MALVDSQEALKAVAKLLDDDATLMDTVHEVAIGGRRDEGRGKYTNPYVTVTGAVDIDPDHAPIETHRVQITISADNISQTRVPDEGTLGDIKSRIHALLDGARPAVTGAKCAVALFCTTVTGALFDPDVPDEHYCAMRWEWKLLPS